MARAARPSPGRALLANRLEAAISSEPILISHGNSSLREGLRWRGLLARRPVGLCRV